MPWTWQEAVGWLEIFTVIWMAERGREGGRERERKDESWAWCLFNMPTQSMCPADHWEGCWGGCYSRNTVITLSQRGYFKTISQRLVQKKKKKNLPDLPFSLCGTQLTSRQWTLRGWPDMNMNATRRLYSPTEFHLQRQMRACGYRVPAPAI